MISIKGHRVLLKLERLEDVDPVYRKAAAAGIEFAKTEESKTREVNHDKARVVAVGGDAFKQFYINCNGSLDGFEPWCKVGDLVAYAKYSGKIIEDPETHQMFVVINDEDVVAVLEG
jgi:co-chaperonin GroES (HSP10)